MRVKEKGSPEIQVRVNILQVKPTAAQLSHWRRLWDHLVACRDTNAPEPCSCEDKEAPDPGKE